MKVLVTGGAGFIGSHIVDTMIEAGHEVTVLDNLDSGRSEYLNKRAKFIRGDIKDHVNLSGYDAVCHQAACTSVNLSWKNSLDDASTNIIGTVNLLNLCKEYSVKKFIYASSAAVYGEPKRLPCEVIDRLHPISPYGLSKATAEQYVRMLMNESVVLRYGNVFGPRQSTSKESGVIPIFVSFLMSDTAPLIYGDGEQTRDFVYVKDVAKANLLALNMGAGIYNISSGRSISINEVFNTVKNVMNFKTMEPIYKDEKKGDIKHMILKSSVEMDFTDFDEGIKQTVGWYNEN